MNDQAFSKNEKELLVKKVKKYFDEELRQDIGGFDAEFLIDFFAAELGPYFYNRGLQAAQLLFAEKAEELGYLVQEMEQPTN